MKINKETFHKNNSFVLIKLETKKSVNIKFSHTISTYPHKIGFCVTSLIHTQKLSARAILSTVNELHGPCRETTLGMKRNPTIYFLHDGYNNVSFFTYFMLFHVIAKTTALSTTLCDNKWWLIFICSFI